MSKNFQVLIAFVENNEMSFVSSSRVENLNERRRDRGNTSLPLILLDADRFRWDRCCLERVVVRFADDSCEDFIYSRYLRFHECRSHMYAHPAQRRGSPGLKRGIGNAVRARANTGMYVHTHTHTRMHAWRICSRTFVPSLCSRAFLPSLRHETHTPSRATHFEFVRIREVASTGKWHLNPSIIPHIVPLPMKH